MLTSPQKFVSPTANLPNLVKDGQSPYQTKDSSTSMSAKKSGSVDWLTKARQRMPVVKASKAEEAKNETPDRKKRTPKRPRARKSLDMNI